SGIDDLCEDVIPAVSEWGLIVMTLLLLVGIKICFARRRPTAARCNHQPV
ncbi:MAG: IPTL-CTERM sorting domain-containing protein, partial [Planctomycetes bacterium]|nr:IPTL-CTERM sorting domain-containing protein [Planctomycetota bacterium]